MSSGTAFGRETVSVTAANGNFIMGDGSDFPEVVASLTHAERVEIIMAAYRYGLTALFKVRANGQPQPGHTPSMGLELRA